MTPVAIAFGSNLGDRRSHIAGALARLEAIVQVDAVSSLYETAPMYVTDQPPFLNGALIARADLGPRALLRGLKEIEARVGRAPGSRFGPREIDLDLIAFGALAYRFDSGEKPLALPHPRIPERRFVLLPLFEIAPDLRLPGLGQVRDLLGQTNSQADEVVRLEHAEL